jgi:hypothetical protein
MPTTKEIRRALRQSLGLPAKPEPVPTVPQEGHIMEFPLWSFSKKRSSEKQLHIDYDDGFTAAFGDMTLWNSLAFCVLLPYISSYSCVTTLIRWGHGRSVAPETASMAEGARFRLNTSHHRPDPLVT